MRISSRPQQGPYTGQPGVARKAIPTRLLNNPTSPQPAQTRYWPYGSWEPKPDHAEVELAYTQDHNGHAVNGQPQPTQSYLQTQYIDQHNGYAAAGDSNGHNVNGFHHNTLQPLPRLPTADYSYRQPHFTPPEYREPHNQPEQSWQQRPAHTESQQRNYPPYYGRVPDTPQPVTPYYPAAPPAYNGFSQQPGLALEQPPMLPFGPQYSEPEYTEDNVLLVRGMESASLVEHPGSVVVVGDVGPESKVVAGGSVFVWGRLQGAAHAGAYGGALDPMVVAAEMQPQELQIDSLAAYPPSQTAGLPVVALLDESGAQIELDRTNKIYSPQEPDARSPTASGTLSSAGRAALITGLYITMAGLLLLLRPQLLYLMFDASSVSAGWVRVGAVLCMLFGSYYMGAAYGESSGIGLGGFYIATTAGRLFLAAVFALLVAAGQVGPGLLLFAAVNLWGAWVMAAKITAS